MEEGHWERKKLRAMGHFRPAWWYDGVTLYDIVCHDLGVIGGVFVTVGDILSSAIGWAESGFDLGCLDGDLDLNVDIVACLVGVHSLLSCDGKKYLLGLPFKLALKTSPGKQPPPKQTDRNALTNRSVV